jgi:hypothetical protein
MGTYLLTYSWSWGLLRRCQLCSHSRTSQRFVEPEGSLPPSQEPSTGPYPEPDWSNPHHIYMGTAIFIPFWSYQGNTKINNNSAFLISSDSYEITFTWNSCKLKPTHTCSQIHTNPMVTWVYRNIFNLIFVDECWRMMKFFAEARKFGFVKA